MNPNRDPTEGFPAIEGFFIALLFCIPLWGASMSALAQLADCPPNSACLSWLAPTANVDNTPLTDLAGFKLYYGTESGSYTETVNITDPASRDYELILSVPNAPVTYYFALTALDSVGNESDFSNEVARALVLVDTVPPNAPTELRVILNVTVQVPGGVLASE